MSNIASPVLSPQQTAALQFLCAGGRSYLGPLRAATGAGPNTLTTLAALGLVTSTTAGARGTLYHLTESGRDLVCSAANTEPEGGPTMNEDATAVLDSAPTAEDAPADATPAKRRGRKNAELANVAAGDSSPATPAKKATGPTKEMRDLYAATVKAIKALSRGAKTVEKAKYLRIGDSKGKTIAYVNFPTSKSVLVEVPKPKGESGYVTVSCKTDADVEKAVAAVTAYIAARDGASEAPSS